VPSATPQFPATMNATPAIFVINLAYRTDRRQAMQRQLSQVGWSATFFPAVRPADRADFPSIGTRGCFLSHLAVLKRARDEKVQRLVILEDDVDFVPDFPRQWQSVLPALEAQDWSIFYPGHGLASPEKPSGSTAAAPSLTRIAPERGVRCTHFMMLNSQGISTLIGGFEAILSRPAGHAMGGPMHVDGAYSTIRAQHPELGTYAAFPPLGYQRSSRTDVGELKWFDRIGILAPLVDKARNLRTRS
jgi:glycosyl transferase, family 25